MNFLLLSELASAPPTKSGQMILYADATNSVFALSPDGTTKALGVNISQLVPAGGATGQVLSKVSSADFNMTWVNQTGGAGGAVSWGSITGTLSDQTDLNTSLAGKAASSHTHNASDLNAGTVATARLGSGTANATSFLRGDQAYVRSWSTVVKAADESKTSNSALASDASLQVGVAANASYRIRIMFSVTMGVGAFKCRVTGPTSPTLVHLSFTFLSASVTFAPAFAAAFDTADRTYNIDTGPFVGFVDIILQTSGNSGTVALQWAQSVSNAAATVVKAGSCLEYSQA